MGYGVLFPDEDKRLEEDKSYGMFLAAMIILLGMAPFTFIIPNLYVCYTHSKGITVDLPRTLEKMTQ